MAQVRVELTGCASFVRGNLQFLKGEPKVASLSEEELAYLRAQDSFKLKRLDEAEKKVSESPAKAQVEETEEEKPQAKAPEEPKKPETKKKLKRKKAR